jgi:hypothetical protein
MAEKRKPPGAGIATPQFINSRGSTGIYKIQTPEELQALVDSYFKSCDEHTVRKLVGTGKDAQIMTVPEPEPYTWTGLALAVGLSGRQALINYRGRDEFAPILNTARAKIQAQWESKLQRLGNNNGVQFALTNNTLIEGDEYRSKQDINLGGQSDNPVHMIKHSADDLTEEQLRKIREILEAGSDTDPLLD